MVDPAKRLNAEQILSHPWVYGDKAPRTILGNVTENMRQYNIKRKFKVSLVFISFKYREPHTWSWLLTDFRIY